jgi:sulfite exporter TauE/SafE
MNTPLCAAAFFMALVGSPHCALMCGGVAGALGACPSSGPARARRQAGGWLTFQAGRLASYAAVGAAAGWLGDGVLAIGRVGPALLALRVVAGAVLIVVGLTMAGAGSVFVHAAAPAARAWQRLGGLIVRRAAAGPHRALALGLSWGLMPCGFLYAALGLALASADATQGAAVMAAFGAGTLPGLLALSAASRWLAARARAPGVRHAAGLALACLGLVQAAAAFAPAGLLPISVSPACCQPSQP